MSDKQYSHLGAALGLIDCGIAPAEAHGSLCAMVCAGNVCVEELMDGLTIGQDQGVRQILEDMEESLRQTFEQASFEFDLLAPSDDLDIMARIEAFVDWCSGFSSGLLTLAGLSLEGLPESSREIVTDMIAFSQGQADTDGSEQEQEKALFELQEYVRVGVQLIYEELLSGRQAQMNNSTGAR